MSDEHLKDQLQSLSAIIAADKEGDEAALKRLSGLVDGDSFRRRLALLLKLRRVGEARALTLARSPEEDWIEQGVRVAAISGDMNLATSLVSAADAVEDRTGSLRLRCATAFIEAALYEHFDHCERSNPEIYRYAVRPQTRQMLRSAIVPMAKFRDLFLRQRTIASQLERDAMTALTLALALLGRQQEAASIISLLVRERPISIDIGRFVLDGRLPLVDGLIEALLQSYPNDFFGKLVALLLVARRSESEWRQQFSKVASLKTLARTSEDRVALFLALSQISQWTGGHEIAEVNSLASILLDKSIVEHRRALAIHELRVNNWPAAEVLVADDVEVKNPLDLWVRAQCDFGQGRMNEGIVHLVEAAVRSLNDDWLQDAAQRSDALRRDADCIRCLELLREYYPELGAARKILATKLWTAGRQDDSIGEWESLVAENSGDATLCLQLARAYLQTNQPQRAIDILDGIGSEDQSDPTASILLALAYGRLGRPNDAFNTLERGRESYWENKDFLLAYLESAYAANEEGKAHRALMALNAMRERGQIDPDQFRVGSLDEVLELIRVSRERRDQANSAIIGCRSPWTVCAEAFRNPLIWDWMLRTQEIKWLAEEVASRAEYSIYATNGFAIERSSVGATLAEIEAQESEAVCVDYSALITLHGLGQIDLLFSVYRKVLIPAEYRMSILEDVRRLQPHQLSHREAAEAIIEMIDLGKIRVASAEEEIGMKSISEYADDPGKNGVRLRSLVDSLAGAGQLDLEAEKRIRALPMRSPERDSLSLLRGDSVLVDLLTMRTLFRESILLPVVSTFRVYVSQADRSELTSEARTFRFQEQARVSLQELWSQVEQRSSVEFVAKRQIERDDEGQVSGLSLLALQLAEERTVPLLADDRVLQAVVANKRGSAVNTGFGTAQLLRLSHDRQLISMDSYAESLEKLIRWRYRFIVIPAEVLHHFAARYGEKTVGQELVLVARYIHDCMNDPGLLGGLESSTPPTSMALKLLVASYAEIGNFMGIVWTDTEISDERARFITEWVAQVMLPAVPIAISEPVHDRMARMIREIAISHALIKSGFHMPHPRVPDLLLLFAQKVGISQRRMLQIHAEVLERVVS